MNSNSKTEYTGHGKLAVGDGSTLSIPHIGTSYLPTCKPLILIRLFLVPSIKKNLISISKFTSDNDVIVEFTSSHYYVEDKVTKIILLLYVLHDDLYKLDLSLSQTIKGLE